MSGMHVRPSLQSDAAAWPGAAHAAYVSAGAGPSVSAAPVGKGRGATADRPRRAWVVAASFALAAFTVFVLLDTFAIGRVQQTVQEADFSSIVAAQGGTTAEDAADGAAGSTGSGETDGGAGPGGSDGGSAAALAAGADDGSDDSASSDADGASGSGDSAAASAGEGGHRHGKHGGPGGKSGSGDADGRSGGRIAGDSGSGAAGASGKSAASANGGELDEGAGSASASGETVGTYSDANMSITVSKVRAYDTDIYVADVQVSSAEYLKTALAQNAFGRNLKETTSDMAESAGAVLAVNGDYYGFRDDGYVVRNGVLYRDSAAAGTDALVVYGDGAMASASQDAKTAHELVDAGAWQVFSFGPTLVQDGKLAVTADSEVSQSMGSNPRTAIGMVSPLHYLVVVSDGRTGDDAGLSLYQLAQVMLDNGATYAYNLDGGGSTTMWFQGQVLNTPTSGNRSGERQVSDIVYFG